MAPHRCHEQRISACRPDLFDGGAQDGDDVPNPTAPGRHRDAAARADPRSQIEPAKLGPNGGRDILDPRPAKPLVDMGHPGSRRGDTDTGGDLPDTDTHGGTPENPWKIAC